MNRAVGWKRAATVAVLATMAAFLITLALPGGLELRITPVKGGPPVLVLPMVPEERFTLYYFHSVEEAPIWEIHSVDESGQIYIETEQYSKFGAGMGRMPGVGHMVRRGPFEVIEHMHRPVNHFVLRVGSPGVDHTIIWRNMHVNLSAAIPHQAVHLAARPVSRAYRLFRILVPHKATPDPRFEMENNRLGNAGGENTLSSSNH